MKKEIKDSIQKDKKIYMNFAILVVLLITVSVMLSSFVMRVFVSPPIESKIIDNSQLETSEKIIQVNVLNGCGTQGLAKKVKDYLRMRGFDVVEIGNYTQTADKSFVIDRMKDINSANKVAYALGIEPSKTESKVDSSMYVRCTVVIGNDYKNLKFMK